MIMAQIAHQIPTQSLGLFMNNTRRADLQPSQSARSPGADFDFEWTTPRRLGVQQLTNAASVLPQQAKFSATRRAWWGHEC